MSTPLLSAPVEAPEAALPILALDGLHDSSDREYAVRVDAPEQPLENDLMKVIADGERIDLNWYHPLSGERALPETDNRRFGALRTGTRPECGLGHCGVDLAGATGTPVYAALPGQVERIVRDADRKGGRYVKLVHEHGISSFYMHLDEINPDLEVGIGVAAGESLGTLGTSGIEHSAPHLHFAVSKDREGGGERFVDPEPMLERAIVLDDPEAIH